MKTYMYIYSPSIMVLISLRLWGGGPRVVVSSAAFHARVRGSVPSLGGLKETKNVSSPSTCKSLLILRYSLCHCKCTHLHLYYVKAVTEHVP